MFNTLALDSSNISERDNRGWLDKFIVSGFFFAFLKQTWLVKTIIIIQ